WRKNMRASVHPLRRRTRWRIAAAAGAVLALAAAGCSSSGGSSGGSSNGKVTITELDYFTSSGGNTALNWYNQKFEKEHPGVTVKRTAVAFADLITKVLQDASAGDMPNLMMLDNPNVAQVAATGQLRAMNDLPGFTTSGYYPGAISECTYQGKQYCYPIGTNSVGLFYNKAMLKAAGLQRVHRAAETRLGVGAGHAAAGRDEARHLADVLPADQARGD